MATRLKVGCTRFPNMTEGQIGFAANQQANVCLKPAYAYENGGVTGFIPIRNHDELLDLVNQIGALSKSQFKEKYRIRPSGTWKNDYIRYLDLELARTLLETGITLTINGEDLVFYTEPGFYQFTDIQPSKKLRGIFGN